MQREAQTTLQTLRDVLRYAVTRFNAAGLAFGHGSRNAYDEAAYLLLHTLKLPIDTLDPFLDARLLASEINTLLDFIERRVELRVPAAYLTNEAWLGPYRFYVDPRVIVPRSFLAELLSERLSPWLPEPDEVANILELCTGSGCLAIIAADQFPDALVDAVDLSPDALAVARQNVEAYEFTERVTLFESDLWQHVPQTRYDVILANPPYVPTASMPRRAGPGSPHPGRRCEVPDRRRPAVRRGRPRAPCRRAGVFRSRDDLAHDERWRRHGVHGHARGAGGLSVKKTGVRSGPSAGTVGLLVRAAPRSRIARRTTLRPHLSHRR
jgi:ribosomal protein L3 glutamine methyltransferase